MSEPKWLESQGNASFFEKILHVPVLPGYNGSTERKKKEKEINLVWKINIMLKINKYSANLLKSRNRKDWKKYRWIIIICILFCK